MSRADKHQMRVGFKGGVQKQIEVEIPEGDIKPWDLDTEHQAVGGRHDRIDAIAKVTGRARFAYDIKRPGLLQGALARSPHKAGKVESIDVAAAREMPGVHAVIELKQAGNKIRYVGDPIAAVAAETMSQARDAIERIQVEYRVDRNAAIDLCDADDAPRLDDAGRVTDAWSEEGGDEVTQALGSCETVRDDTWSCEVQTHSCLESHGLVAEWRDDDGGSLEAWASTQATFGVRSGLARAMDLPEDRVRVHTEFMGGGFGSKFSPGDEGVAAAKLSRETGRPVKLMLSRFEEHTCAGNRPSAIMRIRAGIDGDGIIKAWDYRNWGGPGFSGRGGSTRFVPSYFDQAATRNVQSDLTTATDAGRAMRAPGWPQGVFSSEGMLDELAEAAGIDPLEFRLKNDSDELRQHEWQLGAERFGWKDARNPEPGAAREGLDPRFRRGAGLAAAFWGQMGRTGNEITCRIHQDGTVESRSGAQDLGTGLKTVLAILTAEELGIDPSQVKVTVGDTNDPVGPGSGGSTTTPSVAPTARHAAALAKRELCERVGDALGLDPAQVRVEAGEVIAGEQQLSFAEACSRIGPSPIQATGHRFRNYDGYKENVAGCQFAEVEVDTHTGVVKVLRMLAIQDCGLVIAEKLAESQVIGAMTQGIGYALYEQRLMDRDGRMVNGDFSFYKVPGPLDVPDFDVVMLPVANGKNNVGAAGLGEPPAIAAPAAVANAVSNAIGVRMRSLPITPDKVLAALAGHSEGAEDR